MAKSATCSTTVSWAARPKGSSRSTSNLRCAWTSPSRPSIPKIQKRGDTPTRAVVCSASPSTQAVCTTRLAKARRSGRLRSMRKAILASTRVSSLKSKAHLRKSPTCCSMVRACCTSPSAAAASAATTTRNLPTSRSRPCCVTAGTRRIAAGPKQPTNSQLACRKTIAARSAASLQATVTTSSATSTLASAARRCGARVNICAKARTKTRS